ncbi:carboxylate-amine ligase [Hamadaea tsunoensis]|uniref:carboxylate-amine ligase n=1 Tax=Hamadaea tsunoensis TaxID=53368 RepID=UPI00048892E2|nr:glutamate--cysteine ligase [Hamadaea tsunoensis]
MEAAGATLGVEEEFHVLSGPDGRLSPGSRRLLALTEGEEAVEREFQDSMIETATPVCHDLPGLRTALLGTRRTLVEAADKAGLWLAASGTVPASGTPMGSTFADERYRRISDEYRRLADEQQVCACQVQVGVPDRDLAVQVIARLRGWLPTLLALSASSPFFQQTDSGYASYRAIVLSRWPTNGPPPIHPDYASHLRSVETLIRAGVISDHGMVYYDARPSYKYPTIELRIADACPELDDVLVVAALCRALVITGAAAEFAGERPSYVPDDLLRGATWRAARSGLRGQLIDPYAAEPVRAPVLVGRLLAHLRPALEFTGDWELVSDGVAAILRRGTSAEDQRRILGSGEGLPGIARALVARTRAAL